MMQQNEDVGGVVLGTVNRCRPLNDMDASTTTNNFKRQCLDQNLLTRNNNNKNEPDLSARKSCMDPTTEEMDICGHGCNPITKLSPDEILIQMVQSGCYSHEDVVKFCISSGIPLSRMLRLDLMRLSKTSTMNR